MELERMKVSNRNRTLLSIYILTSESEHFNQRPALHNRLVIAQIASQKKMRAVRVTRENYISKKKKTRAGKTAVQIHDYLSELSRYTGARLSILSNLSLASKYERRIHSNSAGKLHWLESTYQRG